MLLDTSGLFAYADKRDRWHRDAVTYFTAADALITHSYVLAELLPLCRARGMPLAQAVDLNDQILDSEEVEIIWIDEEIHGNAVRLIGQRPDKRYSVCDAVSFVLMRHEGLTEALTTDRHFEQEGFVRLLRD